jgi:hypothetical protein
VLRADCPIVERGTGVEEDMVMRLDWPRSFPRCSPHEGELAVDADRAHEVMLMGEPNTKRAEGAQ